jgi:hypothetical protein
MEIQIKTNVNKELYPSVDAINFDCMVRERAKYIMEYTKDKYYAYSTMMVWVAEQTESVVNCDEKNNIYKFTYIGI